MSEIEPIAPPPPGPAAEPVTPPRPVDPGVRPGADTAPLFPSKPKPKDGGGGWITLVLVLVVVGGLITAGVIFGPRLMGNTAEPAVTVPLATVASRARVPAPVIPLPPTVETPLSATPIQPVPPVANDVGQITSEIERLMAQRYALQAAEQTRAVQEAQAVAAVREAELRRQLEVSAAQLAVSRQRSADAAGELANLIDAGFADRPFVDAAAALVRRLPDNADARALLTLSAAGAPTRAALASDYPRVETAAVRAARAPDSWTSHVLWALTGGAVLRRTGLDAPGDDGVLARAAAHVRSGDLAGAAAELDRASPSVAAATAGWRAAVRRRLEIDRRLPAVRDAALNAVEAAPAVASPSVPPPSIPLAPAPAAPPVTPPATSATPTGPVP